MSKCRDAGGNIAQAVADLAKVAARPPNMTRWSTVAKQVETTRKVLVDTIRDCGSAVTSLPDQRGAYKTMLDVLAQEYPKQADWLKKQRLATPDG
jgi:hypothetical protein